MENNIDNAFKEGKTIKNLLLGLQGESAKKTIQRFSYRFLEGLKSAIKQALPETLSPCI
ncbi:MAG: hypothetical protein N3F66_07150 [Spirochaetes bacterium]|nr:hypothetical protein [Spirochaetota bacterium]